MILVFLKVSISSSFIDINFYITTDNGMSDMITFTYNTIENNLPSKINNFCFEYNIKYYCKNIFNEGNANRNLLKIQHINM